MTSFDALQTVWQTDPAPAPTFDADALADLRTEAERFDRAIWWRDLREYAAAVFVAVMFGWGFPSAPPAARIGIVLAVLGAAFVCVWMWRAQRQRPPAAPSAPIAEALRIALSRVEIQIRLLRTVVWWYIAPLMVGPLWITVVGMIESFRAAPPIETTRNLIGASIALALAALIVVAIGGFLWWIWRLNQRAVARDLLPLRDRLADSLHALTDSDA